MAPFPPDSPHQQLWAPWRLAYVAGGEQQPVAQAAELAWLPDADRACFLCRAVAENADRANLLVRRGPRCVTMLNRFPYNNGHLLVAPARHVARLDGLSTEEHLELSQTLGMLVRVLEETLAAEGCNIGLNLGRAAGAGLPGHLHWHLVPRWAGDTNYMGSLAGVRVIPQSLDALWDLLQARPAVAP